MKKYTMVVRHGNADDKGKVLSTLGYTLISPDYKTITLSAEKIKESLSKGEAEISNLGLNEKGELVGTNGAIDKYTFVDVNTIRPVGKTKAVIINRIEQNDKLVGYTIFTADGVLAEEKLADVVKLAQANMIANGKIRHTATGDIVSSIKGDYEIRKYKISEAPKGKVSIDIGLFKHISGLGDFFAGIVYSTSASELAEIGKKLSLANAKVQTAVAEKLGKSEAEAAKLQRYGANGIYGLFKLSDLDTLIKGGATLFNQFTNGNIIIEYAAANADKEIEHHVIETVSTDFKVKNEMKNTDEKTAAETEKLIKKLSEKYSISRKKKA